MNKDWFSKITAQAEFGNFAVRQISFPFARSRGLLFNFVPICMQDYPLIRRKNQKFLHFSANFLKKCGNILELPKTKYYANGRIWCGSSSEGLTSLAVGPGSLVGFNTSSAKDCI
jgi:hypothetical protein